MSVLLGELTKRRIKAVIFDLDDTLFPELEYVESGFKAVSGRIKADFGIDPFDLLKELFAADPKNVYPRALDRLGVKYDESYISALVDIYRNHTPRGLGFFSDVMPFIAELKSRGIVLGIITDGRVEGQKKKLEALGCYNLFDKIIITDELGKEFRKPSDEAFKVMSGQTGVALSETAYIGDNPAKDFYIGSEGVFTVRVLRAGALNLGGESFYMGVKPCLTVESLI